MGGCVWSVLHVWLGHETRLVTATGVTGHTAVRCKKHTEHREERESNARYGGERSWQEKRGFWSQPAGPTKRPAGWWFKNFATAGNISMPVTCFLFLCPLNTFSLSPMQKDHQKNHTMSMLGLQKADLKKAKIKADVLLCRCTFLPPVCLTPDQERWWLCRCVWHIRKQSNHRCAWVTRRNRPPKGRTGQSQAGPKGLKLYF